jgi:hypothetical protein
MPQFDHQAFMRDLGQYEKCPICKEYGWTGTHNCDPVWYCRPDYYDREEGTEVHAENAEEAAEEYLENRFHDFDCPSAMTVMVVNSAGTVEYKVEVEVEAVPSFSASQVEEHAIEPEQEQEEIEGDE